MSFAFHITPDANREQKQVFADQLKKILYVRWGGESIYDPERAILIWKYTTKDGKDQKIKVSTIEKKLGGIVKKIPKIIFIRDGISNDEYFELAEIEEACDKY